MAVIYWGSNLTNPRFPLLWEPAILQISRANGHFPCRWSTLTLAKGNNPTGKKYAIGVAEVTAAQQAAIDADPVNIFSLTEAQIKLAFSSLPKPPQTRINSFCTQIGVSQPAPSEIMFDLWNRIAVATDNKTLTI